MSGASTGEVRTAGGQVIRRVAVPYGGWSHEANYSSAPWVLRALEMLGLEVVPLDLRDPAFLTQLLAARADVVFPQTLGAYGEDGTLQGLLDFCDLRYVGSGVSASAVGAQKAICNDVARGLGSSTEEMRRLRFTAPRGIVLPADTALRYADLVTRLDSPFVLKPLASGASFGVSLIADERSFDEAYEATVREYRHVLAEQYVTGAEYTVGIVEDDARSVDLPICAVHIADATVYMQDDKIGGHRVAYHLPAPLDDATTWRLHAIARAVFDRLGGRGFVRVDLILTADGVVHILEVNTLPGLIPGMSIFPAMCAAIGVTYEEMMAMLLRSAYRPQPLRMSKLAHPPDMPAGVRARLPAARYQPLSKDESTERAPVDIAPTI